MIESTSEVIRAGYLTKSPPDVKNPIYSWKRRYFVFLDSHRKFPLAPRQVRLEYYATAELVQGGDPLGVIDLHNCSGVLKRDPLKGHKHLFDVVTPDRVYHMSAESNEEKEAWVVDLMTNIFSSITSPPLSPTPQDVYRQQSLSSSLSSGTMGVVYSSVNKRNSQSVSYVSDQLASLPKKSTDYAQKTSRNNNAVSEPFHKDLPNVSSYPHSAPTDSHSKKHSAPTFSTANSNNKFISNLCDDSDLAIIPSFTTVPQEGSEVLLASPITESTYEFLQPNRHLNDKQGKHTQKYNQTLEEAEDMCKSILDNISNEPQNAEPHEYLNANLPREYINTPVTNNTTNDYINSNINPFIKPNTSHDYINSDLTHNGPNNYNNPNNSTHDYINANSTHDYINRQNHNFTSNKMVQLPHPPTPNPYKCNVNNTAKLSSPGAQKIATAKQPYFYTNTTPQVNTEDELFEMPYANV